MTKLTTTVAFLGFVQLCLVLTTILAVGAEELTSMAVTQTFDLEVAMLEATASPERMGQGEKQTSLLSAEKKTTRSFIAPEVEGCLQRCAAAATLHIVKLSAVVFVTTGIRGPNTNGSRTPAAVAVAADRDESAHRLCLSKCVFGSGSQSDEGPGRFVTQRSVWKASSPLQGQAARPGARRQGAGGLQGSMPGFNYSSAYSNLTEMNARADRLARDYWFVEKLIVGQSANGGNIFALRMSKAPKANIESQSEFLFIGATHAREWISAEIPLAMAEMICYQFSRNSRVQNLVRHAELWFIPVANPDGYAYTFESGNSENGGAKRWWRKNRHSYVEMTGRADAIGVDLNRNYPYQWGGSHSSGSPDSDTYRGPSAGSEPEVQTLMNVMRNPTYFSKVGGFISFHSYGEYILWPYGYSTEPSARSPVHSFLEALGNKMASMQQAVPDGHRYKAMSGAQMYPVHGDGMDWVHHNFSLVPSYTFEARPDNAGCCAFNLPTDKIAVTVNENAAATFFMIDYLLQYPTKGTTQVFQSGYLGTDLNSNGVVDYFESDENTRYFLICFPEVAAAPITLVRYAKEILNETSIKPVASKVYLVQYSHPEEESCLLAGVPDTSADQLRAALNTAPRLQNSSTTRWELISNPWVSIAELDGSNRNSGDASSLGASTSTGGSQGGGTTVPNTPAPPNNRSGSNDGSYIDDTVTLDFRFLRVLFPIILVAAIIVGLLVWFHSRRQTQRELRRQQEIEAETIPQGHVITPGSGPGAGGRSRQDVYAERDLDEMGVVGGDGAGPAPGTFTMATTTRSPAATSNNNAPAPLAQCQDPNTDDEHDVHY